MNFTRAVLLIPAVLLSASTGTPQTSSETTRQEVAPARDAAPAASSEAQRQNERGISAGLAANLARAMPRYNPPPEPQPQPKIEEEVEADQPRNQILRLPKVVVEGQRPPVFTERELHTKEGLEALAVARYLTEFDRGVLNRYRLPFVGMSAEQRAMMMYEEEERLKNIEQARQTVYVLKQVDPEEARQLKKEADAAYIRKSDFQPTSGVR